ncbi:lysozyme inhibitor LprI family protein [Paracoccus lutimaris]|uniref:Uncharacterized protein YecT (DUF1311 family) n=1 Tax=Paracoccus lutimaris TaxID=1490030 RepID=A0A368Z2F8_9RHOB|nr:lysozyme inhibitor LprI family protein [Paracoccus lutimaris]RCW86640.1 uncharacterized protein YecT (DUF1311 family) [Paracoccus lutimaris]
MRALAALLLLAAPALAQEGVPGDAAGLATCMAAPGEDTARASCAQKLTDACLASPEGMTTLGMTACLVAETTAWDKLLNDRYAALLVQAEAFDRELEPDSPYAPSAPVLQQMQRAWIEFRDASCAYAVTPYAGGTMAGIAYEGCLRELTAAQAQRLGILGKGNEG